MNSDEIIIREMLKLTSKVIENEGLTELDK